jgi:uncharacterized protein (DUF952 family)
MSRTEKASLIYKILPRAAWEESVAAGRFDGSPVDLGDGFIHFSTAAQARETAAKHFRGQAGLVVAAFAADELGADLRWEASRGGQLFPHLYGPLDPDLATSVTDAPLGADGVPDLGALA